MTTYTFDPFKIGTRHGVEIFLSDGEGFYFEGVDVKGKPSKVIREKLEDLTNEIDRLATFYLAYYGLTIATYEAQKQEVTA